MSAPHLAHWPPGLPHSLDYPPLPAGAILAGAARRFDDRTAIHHNGHELSYAELYRRACAFAHALHDAGVGHGDVVAIHMPNRPAYPVAYYGTMLAGATFTPINPLLPAEDLAFQLADSGAAAVVTWGPAAQVISGVTEHTALRLVVGVDAEGLTPFEEFIDGHPQTSPDVAIDVDRDLAHIAYTGGTTGRSKGVELPHRNVVVNSLQYACWGNGAVPAVDGWRGIVLDQIGPDTEWPVRLGTGVGINLTPWFHAMGTIGALNVPMLAGSTTVLHDRFDPGSYLAEAERFGITSMGGAPALFAALLAHPDVATRDLTTVRGISSGAAPLAHQHVNGLLERFPDAVIAEGYGLTEVTMGATIGPAARSGLRKVGSVGIPVFDTEVRIVEPGGSAPAAPGEPGEVCIRGPQVMRGYRHREQETAEVLSDGGWLRTGDIGVLDADGYLSIVDRTKDMLLYKGYNVYPREIEELLVARPEVATAAVVGRPDAVVGELPVAFVVSSGEEVDGDTLMRDVNERLAPYKQLRELHLTGEIPVSAAGKVLKRELRERL